MTSLTEMQSVAGYPGSAGTRAPPGGPDDALGEVVELPRGHAGGDPRPNLVQHAMDDAVRLVHQLDLPRGLEDHHTRTPKAPSKLAVTSSIGRLPSIARSRPRSL